MQKLSAEDCGVGVDGGGRRKRRKSSNVTLSPETLEAEEHRATTASSSSSSRRLTPKRSSFVLAPHRPLKHYLTREVLPHVDHYRNRLSFNKGNMTFLILCLCCSCC